MGGPGSREFREVLLRGRVLEETARETFFFILIVAPTMLSTFLVYLKLVFV